MRRKPFCGSQFVGRAGGVLEERDGFDDGCHHAFGVRNAGEFGDFVVAETFADDGGEKALGQDRIEGAVIGAVQGEPAERDD